MYALLCMFNYYKLMCAAYKHERMSVCSLYYVMCLSICFTVCGVWVDVDEYGWVWLGVGGCNCFYLTSG